MMYRKAVCFNDRGSADKILETDDVAEIKALGRGVSGYDDHCAAGNFMKDLLLSFCRTKIWRKDYWIPAMICWQSVLSKTGYGASDCR